MVNVQSIADSLLLFTALLAGVVVAYSYFAPQGVVEFRRIANVEPSFALSCKVDAIRTIDFSVTPADKTLRFAHSVTTSTSTINGYGVVVAVVFAASAAMFCRPLTFTFLIAKMMCYTLEMPARLIKHLAAVFAGDIFSKFGLHPRMMIVNKLSLTPPLVVLLKRFSASTSAFYQCVAHG